MNILLINHYAGSPSLGMEFRPYYMGQEWIRMGHTVMIVASTFSHLRSNNPTFSGLKKLEKVDGITYLWVKTSKYAGNGIGRVGNMLSFVVNIIRLTRFIAKSFNPDVVVASSTYPFDIFPARKIAKLARAKLVFEVHDLWPLSPMQLGGYSKYHPFILLTQYAEDYAYKHANSVVSMLPKALPYMISRGLDPEKFICIPNGYSDANSNQSTNFPVEHIELIKSLKANNQFLIGYAGGHAISNALDTLIDVALLAKNKYPMLSFVLVGKGVEKENLISKAEKLALKNVYFLSEIDKLSVKIFLNNMDVLFIGWNKNPLYKFGISPNKLIDYMLASKPVIHSVDAGNDLVEEANCGISVPAQDASSILDGIICILNMREENRKKLGENGRSYAMKFHNYYILSKKFIDFVNS
jgi:glycosyltransferase involved in cell wall biosynthesis